jgi:NADH-quinone oxidoreductase subunit D
VYFAVEGGNGELGFYLVSDGSEKPWKCRCRPPCFPIVEAMPKMLEGAMVADIIPTFGMANMIGGEMDR